MIPVHIDQQFNSLYISYIDDGGNKHYKKDSVEYEFFVSKKDEPIISLNDAKRIVYKTAKEKKTLLEKYSQQGYHSYLADFSLTHQYYLTKFSELNELPYFKPKIAFIDIEALITGRFTINGEYPITAITIGILPDKLITFGYHEKFKEPYYDKENSIFIFPDELMMLKTFVAYMKKMKFDIMSGWNFCSGENGSGFDNPYLINRLKKFKLDSKLSPFGIVKQKYRYEDYEVFGLPSIDYLSIYRKFQFKELPSYKLSSVAEEENIASKIEFDGSLNDLYYNDFEKYIEYNRRDVKILLDLENKKQYFELITEIRNISFVNLNTINNSTLIDNILVRSLRKNKKIAKTKKFRSGSGIPGAYVKEPKPGIYDWIIDLDYTSLYPFIIMNLNISPETKIGYIENWNDININVESLTDDVEDAYNIIDKTKNIKVCIQNKSVLLTYDQFQNFIHENDLIVSNIGILFSKKAKGIFPEVLHWIFEMRTEYKKLKIKANKENDDVNKNLYHYKQLAFKILLNSFYGFTAFPGSRFFDKEIGASITMTGRKLIRYAIQEAAKQNYTIITTDTDSILFTKNNITNSNTAIQMGKKLSNDINSQLINWCKQEFNVDNSSFYIKQEIVALRGLFFAKKRYSLWKINEEGVDINEIEHKGVDIIRNSTPPIVKEWLMDIFKSALKYDKKKSINIVPDKIKKYREKLREVNTDYIGIRTSISKDIFNGYKNLPVHVRGALVYEALFADENISFENEIKGRYYFLNENTKLLNPIRTDEQLSELLLGTNNKENVITIPETSNIKLQKEDINYDIMEDRLINNPLKHLIYIYDMMLIESIIEIINERNVNKSQILQLVKQYMVEKQHVELNEKNIKKLQNKNLRDKYYGLFLTRILLNKINIDIEEFQQYLYNEINNTGEINDKN